jgi:DNA-binding ferritin-like protein
MKRVKKRDTGKFEVEPGPPLYGLTLSHCLNKIIHHRTAKKFADENVTLKEFLKELQKNYEEIVKLCRETLPEKFDTGE